MSEIMHAHPRDARRLDCGDEAVADRRRAPSELSDWVRRPIIPEFYVDITSVIDKKEQMLACHASQREWLDKTQGFDSYLKTMRDGAEKIGAMSGAYRYAEAWRRHSHIGFSREDGNPLARLIPGFCSRPAGS